MGLGAPAEVGTMDYWYMDCIRDLNVGSYWLLEVATLLEVMTAVFLAPHNRIVLLVGGRCIVFSSTSSQRPDCHLMLIAALVEC